jgi:magnesium and cobalt transporter|tara:strand:+ start:6893 stop:7735 length:843 start_codon:yes stop_codon:yes gene_type:complete
MSEGSPASSKRTLLEWVSGLFSDEPSDRSELMEMLREASERQIMDAEALNIIFGALQVSDMQARDIMIPRTQLVYLKAGDAPDVLLPTIIESQHSRYPVIGDDLDDIKGILHAKDLLPLILSKDLDHFDIKDCIRPATVVPESKRLNVLLQDFRNTRNHMAVVVDEYGHVSGVVTIEDVLEQIVGEIEDEHDIDEEGFIKQLDSHTFNVKATTAVDDFNEYFGVSLDEEEFDTVGGLVLKAFGHLPDRGEVVELDNLRFKVLNADSRRLRLLQVERATDS